MEHKLNGEQNRVRKQVTAEVMKKPVKP